MGIVFNSIFECFIFKVFGDICINDCFKVFVFVNYINFGGDCINWGFNLFGVMLGLICVLVMFDFINGLDNVEDEFVVYFFLDGIQCIYWSVYDNFYWFVNCNLSCDCVNCIIGNVGFEYMFMDWFSIFYWAGMDYYFEEWIFYWDNNSNEFGIGVIFSDLYFYCSFNFDFLLIV